MFASLLDLLFPPCCAGCQARGDLFCTQCRRTITEWQHHVPRCQRCDRPARTSPCPECRALSHALEQIRGVGPYDGTLRTALLALKFKRQRALAAPFGDLLAERYRQMSLKADMLLSVPMQRDRQRERGFNQSALLADSCGGRLHLPVAHNLLTRTRAAPRQHDLTATERRTNVIGLFTSTDPLQRLHGKRVIIVDDIMTTGATLGELATVVQEAGATCIGALVVGLAGRQES